MAPDIAAKLFDPFFTTKGDAGTGLGVPQVVAFMLASGGMVCARTEPGAGTCLICDFRRETKVPFYRSQSVRWIVKRRKYFLWRQTRQFESDAAARKPLRIVSIRPVGFGRMNKRR